jgi:UDP-2,3-diacylglucosamine pyrophosphatase LpxH
MTYRSIWLSDLHMGANNCNISKLLDFLKHNDCENLFIVGDFIDGWELKRKWNWTNEYNTLIQKLLRKSRHGTNIFIIIGNHDEFLFNFENFEFGNIKILREYIHTTNNNQKVLVIHGDQFDGIIKYTKWLQHLGSYLYNYIIDINTLINKLSKKHGSGKTFSFAKFIKQNTKSILSFINEFETCISTYTIKKECQSVIAGHIHTPIHKVINGINYFNCGSFQENEYHAVVEHIDGRLELIKI